MRQYDLRFNDNVYDRFNKPVDPIELNALVCNAVSSAHTLVESLEAFDHNYLLNAGMFKDNYISKIYDDCISYRIVDTLRNFMQHGHIPISYNEIESKIYFNLSEILDIKHMKMNAKLRELLKEVEQQLLESEEATDTKIACVFTLYEYFLQIYNLYVEFYSYTESEILKLVSDVKLVVFQHPEYYISGNNLIASHIDEKNILHVFPGECKLDIWYKQNQIFAQTEYRVYKNNNRNLFSIKMRYALENRIPIVLHVGDECENNNLAKFCVEHFPNVRHLSFDKYYGGMEMHAIQRLYPYIEFEKGLRWNVPYEEVRICDFLRTFPEARQRGIEAVANNIGGAGELFEFLIQQWNAFFIMVQKVLQAPVTKGFLNAIDWVGRVTTVLDGYRWFKASFSTKKNEKPTVQCLLQYIKRRNSWNLCELSDVLLAGEEYLKVILEVCGYVSTDGLNYVFDQVVADKIRDAEECELQKKYNDHGTDVNCYSMNDAVEQLNVDLMYLAVLLMDENKLDEFDDQVACYLTPLEDWPNILSWNQVNREVRIEETLPVEFDQNMEDEIWAVLMKIDESVRKLCAQMESLS